MFERKHGRKIRGTFKLENNIARAKSRIYEIAMCNDWTHFITCTLDKNKYDRYDLPVFQKDLSQFIRDQRKKYKAEIKYLLIPEQHKDGAWHMHGLLQGLQECMLSDYSETAPLKLKKSGYKEYRDYSRKFGWCSVGIIESKERISCYITKYITKDMAAQNIKLRNHLYYCSLGLRRAEKIKQGKMVTSPEKWDFENQYVKMKWIKKEDIDKYII